MRVNKMRVDEMGVDKIRVDEMGVDEMRTYRWEACLETPFLSTHALAWLHYSEITQTLHKQ